MELVGQNVVRGSIDMRKFTSKSLTVLEGNHRKNTWCIQIWDTDRIDSKEHSRFAQNNSLSKKFMDAGSKVADLVACLPGDRFVALGAGQCSSEAI